MPTRSASREPLKCVSHRPVTMIPSVGVFAVVAAWATLMPIGCFALAALPGVGAQAGLVAAAPLGHVQGSDRSSSKPPSEADSKEAADTSRGRFALGDSRLVVALGMTSDGVAISGPSFARVLVASHGRSDPNSVLELATTESIVHPAVDVEGDERFANVPSAIVAGHQRSSSIQQNKARVPARYQRVTQKYLTYYTAFDRRSMLDRRTVRRSERAAHGRVDVTAQPAVPPLHGDGGSPRGALLAGPTVRVPEPGSLVLLAFGLLIAWSRRLRGGGLRAGGASAESLGTSATPELARLYLTPGGR